MAEGLLAEITQLLAARLVIKAGDQAYFSGKQVYGNVSNSGASTSGAKQPEGGNAARIVAEIEALKKENADIKQEIANLKGIIEKIQSIPLGAAPASAPAPAPAAAPAPAKEAEGDDFDLFGSEDEEEDEEKKKIVEERLKAYAEKKSKKAGPIAKSSVILDVKPWDDETDLAEMERLVRSIEMDGLVWGGAKLIAIGYGIQKLQIISVVEDAKVSVDDLIETITEFEDHVQSVDIVAFNKI